MASKAIYTVVAFAGIAAASGAAWWYQQPRTAKGDAIGSANSSATQSPSRAASGSGGGQASGKPPTVEVARVELATLTDDSQAVGSLRSRRAVILRPEVSGRITQLNFTDGQRVRKGQLLVQFDDQLPLAQVQQSQAELSIAQANLKRNQELVAQNFVSQRSLDESAANLQIAQAKLSLSQASAARLKIIAPFDGIAGIRQVNVGDYLKDGADIVNIEDIDAIFVDFRLPERYQSKVKRGQTAILDIDALPGVKYKAQVQAIDPLIDANGRSVGIRGCIDNRQLQLRPGMFARVNAVFGVRENARVIPEEAIVPQGGKQFVIKLLDGANADTKTTQRVEVKVGLRTPGKAEILQGLEAGDTVVIAGQQRLQREGMAVTVVDLSAKPARTGGSASTNTSTNAGASSGANAATTANASPAAGQTAQLPVQAVVLPAVLPLKAKPATSGANPCGLLTADASSAMPGESARPAKQPAPAGAATRNPA